MKKIVGLTISLTLLFTSIALSEPLPPLISVIGEAEVTVVPDEVVIILGVESRANSVKEAKEQNDSHIASIFSFSKKIGIAEKDMQTSYININPQYSYDNGQQSKTPTFYQVDQTVQLTLRAVSKIEELFSGVLEAGANRVQGVQFQSSKIKQLKTEARAAALRNAKEKAEAMAKELDQGIGQPYSIEEESLSNATPFLAMAPQRMAKGDAMAGGDAPSVALGQITVSSSVTVRFLLRGL